MPVESTREGRVIVKQPQEACVWKDGAQQDWGGGVGRTEVCVSLFLQMKRPKEKQAAVEYNPPNLKPSRKRGERD